jgi:hypothetical protein
VDYQVKLKSHIQTQLGSPILLKQPIITVVPTVYDWPNAKGLAHLLFSKIKQLHLFIYKYLLSNKQFRSYKTEIHLTLNL